MVGIIGHTIPGRLQSSSIFFKINNHAQISSCVAPKKITVTPVNDGTCTSTNEASDGDVTFPPIYNDNAVDVNDAVQNVDGTLISSNAVVVCHS